MILSNYLYGWDSLEPIIMGTLSRGMNMLLLGSHGCGKTRFGHFISEALSNGKELTTIKYSMDKENLLSMVGIPSPEALKQGRIEYCEHNRSIFRADVAIFDELTRASKENQNMVLEMLEERTVFGMPLKYKFVVATANDQSYKAAYSLDAALLDRFVVVLPVPSINNQESNYSSDDVEKMILLNLIEREGKLEETHAMFRECMSKIKTTYDEIWNNKKLRGKLIEFTSKFFVILRQSIRDLSKGTKSKSKFSDRQVTEHFVPLAISTAAYYKSILEIDDYLQKGAWDAVQYSIGSKLGIPVDTLQNIFGNFADLLEDGDIALNKIRILLTTGTVGSRLAAVDANIEIFNQFEQDETINILGNIIQEIDAFEDNDMSDEAVTKQKGNWYLQLHKTIKENNINDVCLYKLKLKLFEITPDTAAEKVLVW